MFEITEQHTNVFFPVIIEIVISVFDNNKCPLLPRIPWSSSIFLSIGHHDRPIFFHREEAER